MADNIQSRESIEKMHVGETVVPGKPLRELSVKINVDVSEALTGLKAVQREAREATKALAELRAEQNRHE